MNRQMQAKASTCHSAPHGPVIVVSLNCGAAPKTASYCSDPVYMNRHAMPIRNPRSPTRLTRNAFKFARIADSRSNQNPISRYDTTPTASQPKKSCMKLFDITSMSIAKVNSEM